MKSNLMIVLLVFLAIFLLSFLFCLGGCVNTTNTTGQIKTTEDIEVALESSDSKLAEEAKKIFKKYENRNISEALTKAENENIVIPAFTNAEKDRNFIIYTYEFEDKSSMKVRMLIDGMIISEVE